MPSTPSFVRAVGNIASATLLTRLFGLARDITIAHLFGASAALDAFFIAFKIPNFLRRLFAEGAFSQSLVPMLSQSENPTQLFQSVLTVFLLMGIGVTLIAEFFAPFWVHCFAPGFSGNSAQFMLTVFLFRIIFPFLALVLVAALFSAALNVSYIFSWPALSPVCLNLTTLAAALFLAPHLTIPISALAWGVLVGGGLQVLMLLPILRRRSWLLWPTLSAHWDKVWHVIANTVPGIISVSILQMGLVVDVILASYLPSGNISHLFYADRLVSLPIGLIGVAVSSALLPYLSELKLKNAVERHQQTVIVGLRLILLCGLPATIGLVMLAIPITSTVFQSGKFTANDVLNAGACLKAFALGLPAIMLTKVFASTSNAKQHFRMPCLLALGALSINILLGYFLMNRWGSIGLAYSTTIATWLNVIGIGCYSLRAVPLLLPINRPPPMSWRVFLSRLVAGLIILILFLLYFQPKTNHWLVLSYGMRWCYLLLLIGSSLVIFSATLFVAGLRWKHVRGN